MSIRSRIVEAIIRRAQRTPYFHLTHRDGTPYMDRWWFMPAWTLHTVDGELKPKPWMPFAVRVHHIRSSDHDRHLHDHPFGFVTWLMRGAYWELLPRGIDPQWAPANVWPQELVTHTFRQEGSIIRHRACDRHALRIAREDLDVGVWTLFIQFRKVQPWGFYTPTGKVYWHDYDRADARDRYHANVRRLMAGVPRA